MKRLDHQGLVWFIDHDTELLAITDTTARFRKPSGAVQSVTRKPIKEAGGVPVWAICKNRAKSARGDQQAKNGAAS